MSVRMCEICWRLNKERTNHVTLYEAALKITQLFNKGPSQQANENLYIYI